MRWQHRISQGPSVLAGKPVVKGTRVSVERITDLLAAGWSEMAKNGNDPIVRTSQQLKAQRAIRKLRGRIRWTGDLNAMRTDH